MAWVIVLLVAVAVLGVAAGYDRRQRRRGSRLRSGGEIFSQAEHGRLDIQSQGGGLHGPREQGGFDWATHRRGTRRS